MGQEVVDRPLSVNEAIGRKGLLHRAVLDVRWPDELGEAERREKGIGSGVSGDSCVAPRACAAVGFGNRASNSGSVVPPKST